MEWIKSGVWALWLHSLVSNWMWIPNVVSPWLGLCPVTGVFFWDLIRVELALPLVQCRLSIASSLPSLQYSFFLWKLQGLSISGRILLGYKYLMDSRLTVGNMKLVQDWLNENIQELKMWEITEIKMILSSYWVAMGGDTWGSFVPLRSRTLLKSQQKYIGLCSEELDLLVLAPVKCVKRRKALQRNLL